MSYVELAELCIGSLVGLVEGSLFYYMAIVCKGYEFNYVTDAAFVIYFAMNVYPFAKLVSNIIVKQKHYLIDDIVDTVHKELKDTYRKTYTFVEFFVENVQKIRNLQVIIFMLYLVIFIISPKNISMPVIYFVTIFNILLYILVGVISKIQEKKNIFNRILH